LASKALEAADRWMRQGLLEEAREELVRALEETPDDPHALLAMARVLLAQGKDAQARPFLVRLLTEVPRHPESTAHLLRIDAEAGSDPALAQLRDVAKLPQTGFFGPYNLGRALLSRRDAKGAIAALEEALSRRAGEGHAYAYLGQARMLAGDLAGAQRDLVEAARALPHERGPVAVLAGMLARQGKVREAVVALEEAIGRAPDALALYPELIRLYLFAQELPKAVRLAVELRARVPDSADGAYLQGLASLLSGTAEEADRLLNEALVLAPGSVEARLALAQVKQVRKDVRGAQAVLEEAVELAPTAPGPANELAVLCLAQPGRPNLARAQAVLRRALAAHPDDAGLNLNLALSLADGDPAGARACARKAAAATDAGIRDQAERLLKALGG
jgi:tetratricopeptide (TPR) repeat protein